MKKTVCLFLGLFPLVLIAESSDDDHSRREDQNQERTEPPFDFKLPALLGVSVLALGIPQIFFQINKRVQNLLEVSLEKFDDLWEVKKSFEKMKSSTHIFDVLALQFLRKKDPLFFQILNWQGNKESFMKYLLSIYKTEEQFQTYQSVIKNSIENLWQIEGKNFLPYREVLCGFLYQNQHLQEGNHPEWESLITQIRDELDESLLTTLNQIDKLKQMKQKNPFFSQYIDENQNSDQESLTREGSFRIEHFISHFFMTLRTRYNNLDVLVYLVLCENQLPLAQAIQKTLEYLFLPQTSKQNPEDRFSYIEKVFLNTFSSAAQFDDLLDQKIKTELLKWLQSSQNH